MEENKLEDVVKTVLASVDGVLDTFATGWDNDLTDVAIAVQGWVPAWKPTSRL